MTLIEAMCVLQQKPITEEYPRTVEDRAAAQLHKEAKDLLYSEYRRLLVERQIHYLQQELPSNG